MTWNMTQVMRLMFHELTAEDPFVGRCNGCHIGGDTEPPNIPRTAPEFYTTVTTFVADKCFDFKLVEPGDADKSALYLVLRGECEGGLKMPLDEFGGATPEEVEGVRSWIMAGAEM